VLARRAPGGPPKAEPGAAPGRGGAQRSRLDLIRLNSAVQRTSGQADHDWPQIVLGQAAQAEPLASSSRSQRHTRMASDNKACTCWSLSAGVRLRPRKNGCVVTQSLRLAVIMCSGQTGGRPGLASPCDSSYWHVRPVTGDPEPDLTHHAAVSSGMAASSGIGTGHAQNRPAELPVSCRTHTTGPG
jgi:hypothetical protein